MMSTGPKVRAQNWEMLESHFLDLRFEPLRKLLQIIHRSPGAYELYGAKSMWTLLISNEPEFEMFGNAIHIDYNWETATFSFKHRVNPGPEDSRVCAAAEGESTLKLFLKYKYGVLLN